MASAKMKERGSDLTIFSPRASFMAQSHRRLPDLVDVGRHLQRALLSLGPHVGTG
jgi:hypothetical protein